MDGCRCCLAVGRADGRRRPGFVPGPAPSAAVFDGSGARLAAVTEVSILAGADTYIAAEEPDRNFRTAPELLVHHTPPVGTVGEQIKVSLLHVSDLSAILAGAQLQYAWLRLRLLGAGGTSAGPVNTCAIEGPWSVPPSPGTARR